MTKELLLTDLTYKAVFSLDMDERKDFWQQYDFAPEEYRLVGKGGKVLAGIAASEGNKYCNFMAEGGWVRAEVWSCAMGKECCLAFTNAIYFR